MPTPWLSTISRLTAGALLFQTAAPVALDLKTKIDTENVRRRAFERGRATPPPMKGVPLMDVTPLSVPSSIRSSATLTARSEGTILNEVGRTDKPVLAAQRVAWRAQVAGAGLTKAQTDWRRLWLAESDLAREYPGEAVGRIDVLLKGGATPQIRGLALHDRAIALFYMGRYGDARRAFEAELRGKGVGFNRRNASLWVRHARACEGYHRDNERLGVPIPQRLDPLCGASAVATCLRSLGLPYDKATLSRTVHHTGEGSDLQNLADACDRLGVAANPVQATEKGLMGLPLPAVAHVEGDHFVAVVHVDKDGVEYVCSDCGAWPGGPIRVTWKAWRAMKPGAYMTVTKFGSPQQSAMERLVPRKRASMPPHVYSAPMDVSVGVTQSGLSGTAARIVTTLTNNVSPLLLLPYYFCGLKPTALHCPDFGYGPCCPEDLLGFPFSEMLSKGGAARLKGPSAGDPVNLATGEEEYRPAPDLTVYNPTGPSVVWSRSYNSLSSGSNMNQFGVGWSQPYNVMVRVGTPTPPPPGSPPGSAVTTDILVFPNNAMVSFTRLGTPSTSNPVVDCAPPPGYAMKMQLIYTASGTKYEVTLRDRIKWTFGFQPVGVVPLARITDNVGNWIGFEYSGAYAYDPGYLTRIYDSGNATLLSIARDSNRFVTSVSDRYGRSVYYAKAASGVEAGELSQVSQVVPTGTANPPVRYEYGYVNRGNGEANSGYPYLGSISVPSPTGIGMATATIDYDALSGFVTKTTDANGNTRNYSATDWDGTANANLTTVKVKGPQGNLVRQYTAGFDGSMNQNVLKNALGQTVWQKNYGSGGGSFKPTAVTDGNGRVWTSTYDQFGNVLTETTPKGTTTTYTYDDTNFALGELTSVKQGAKTAATLTYYQPSGLIHEVFTPIPGGVGDGATQATTYWYDAVGNVTHIAKPGNNPASSRSLYFGYTTDGVYSQPEYLGRPITITDGMGKISHLRYDVRGNIISKEDALGNKISTTYNIADQANVRSLPSTGNTGLGSASNVATYLYPDGPQAKSEFFNESGALARTVSFTYGKEGELISRVGGGQAVTTTYDPVYQPKTVKDGENNLTTYEYSSIGLLTQITSPNASGASYDKIRLTNHDAVGNLLSRTDGNGQVVNYEYNDADGQLSAVNHLGAASEDITYSYDAYGRLSSRTDTAGSYAWRYDDLSNLTGEDTSYPGIPTQTVSFQYWNDGSRKALILPAGRQFNYTYDANGRCTSMSLYGGGGTAMFSYLDNGWQASRAMGNGLTTTYTYNAIGAVTSLANNVGATTISQYGNFVYDGIFNLASVTASVPSASTQSGTTTYGYDAQDRLTSESSTRLGSYSHTNAYDGADNPTTLRNATATFNADNQRTGTGYVYDGNGSPTAYNGSANTYDVEGRLTSRGRFSTKYRADGLRAWKDIVDGGTRKWFLYVDGKSWMEINPTGQPDAINAWAPDGLIGRRQGPNWEFYAYDPQGSVAQSTNMAGTVTGSAAYDAYGNASWTGAQPEIFAYNARWGYIADRETGLYYCQNRYYDPQNGRWVTRDPIGFRGGVNMYEYCGSNPVVRMDPSGLMYPPPPEPGRIPPLAQQDPQSGDVNHTGDTWQDVVDWWSGTDAVGPAGEPVRIGGWHGFFANQGGNAMTVNGTVHLNDHDDYEEYLNSSTWAKHERWHLCQEQLMFHGSPVCFLTASVVGYLAGGSHDGAPLEANADNVAGRPLRDPYGAGLWPYIHALER